MGGNYNVFHPIDHSHPGGLTREHVVWAYRLLLDREPENEDVIGPKLAGSRDTRELRYHLITSAEYREKNPDFAHTNDRTIVISEIEPGVRLFVDLADHVIGLNIVRGTYEREEIAFVRSLLRAGDAAIDVGAHIGFFTMQMAAMVGAHGRVVAFEPLDANAELLERSIEENDFGQRVLFYRAAAGATNGEATLTFPAETLNSGGAYVPAAGELACSTGTRSGRCGHSRSTGSISRGRSASSRWTSRGRSRSSSAAQKSSCGPTARSFFRNCTRRSSNGQLGASAEAYLAQMRALGYRAQTIAGQPVERGPDDAVASVVFVPLD